MPLLGWIINLKNPQVYLLHLWGESFNRTPLAEGGKLITLLKHIFAYPLLNFKQLLPHSLFFLLSKAWKRIKRERATILLLTLIGLNYLPYLISPGARGRYILVIFPFIAVLLAPLLGDFLLKRIKGLKPAIAGIFLILLINLFLVYKNFAFFENYGLLPLLGMFVALTLGGFLILRYFPTLLGLTVVFLALFKFSYINHYAPWKEKRHPEREVALRFSQKLPKGAKIRYLPQRVNMELCAYLDLYTEGLVTRKEGKYFVSRKPPEGDYKILDSYKGWILGEF